MTTKEILLAAKALAVEHPTKFHYARDKSGIPCGATSPDAACWCVIGAIAKVTGRFAATIPHTDPLLVALDKPAREIYLKRTKVECPKEGLSAIAYVNDRFPEEVAGMFDAAIREAEDAISTV